MSEAPILRPGGRATDVERRVVQMPRMKIKDLRRSELIDATIIAVASRGLSDTSLANIADQAGVSPALVSHYFEGKEDLLAATLLRLVKDLATEIRRRTPATA